MTETGTSGWVTVARVGEIPEGGRKIVRIGDQAIGVFHLDGRYCAIEDVCTHDGGPLAEGFVEGGTIECPRHGAKFDLRSGAALTLPAVVPVPTFEVRVEGEEIQVGWA